MQTNKFLLRFLTTCTRLAIFASMLMTAILGAVTPVFAATTGEIVPTGNGFYTSWSNGSAQVDEGTASASCSSFDSIITGTGNNRESVVISLASIPNGSTITSIDVLVRDRRDSTNGGTYATFVRFNSVDSSNSATHTTSGSSLNCTGSYTDTFNVVDTVKGSGTTLQIGVIKLNSGGSTNNSVRVGVLSAVITYSVVKQDQTISFTSVAPAGATVGGPTYTPTATATSGLPVTFTIDAAASSICSIVAGVVSFQAVGTCVVDANQAGDANYNAAPQVQQSFAVASPAGGASFDLYAVTGSTTLSGQPVPVWGYNTSNAAVTQPGGPVLIVNQGSTVNVTLHNQLAENTGVLFQGQTMVPDLVGAGAGGTKTYTFTATNPGTFLYEAALLPNAQHQVAMGLYGALIVRPTGAPTQAYGNSSTAFTRENVMVLSELDTALNNSANPASFDMRNYRPKYFLINGKAYPGTVPFDVVPNDIVLMRYVNAGLQAHAMSTLGLTQTIIAQDGSPYAYSHKVVAETIATGQTLDTLVAIPSTAPNGAKYAVYDANMLLRNNSGTGTTNGGFGGMLTFLAAGEGSSGGFDTTGPQTLNIVLPSSAVAGATIVAVSATVSDVDTGGSNVTAAEYFIDTPGANGSGTVMSGGFGATSVNVSANIPAATVGALATGNHIVYIHGQDAPGNWGGFNQGVLRVDNTPPTITSPSITPSRTNGSVNLALSATATDTATGNSNIAAAEYWIDSGAVSPMTVVTTSSLSGISATIPAATVAALAEGNHTIHIHAQDATNSAWGPDATVALIVDKSGPTTSGVVAEKNPNNGALPYNTSVPAVRVTASFADPISGTVNSNIAAGEGFIDTVGANGTGFVFVAADGAFNSASETGYSDVPLAVINSLSAGDHTIYVHGKDAAGNWGPTSTTVLVIDKTPPAILSINRADPNPSSAASVNFTVTFSEAVTGVSSANFSLVQGAGLTGASITSVTGTGATRTVTASTGSGGGTLGLNLTSATGITDVAGNALPSTGLPYVGQVYTLTTPPLYFSTSGTTNPPSVGGTADDADIYYWNGAAFSRVIDASVAPYSLPTGANVDGFDRVSATSFYMSFNGTVNVPGLGNVDDEDIVFFNGSAWSLYFNGGTNGLGGTGFTTSFDLDAISIVGAGGPGNVYFSTDNNNVPSGAGGSGDDADIYRWNGGSSYTRVSDASSLGWSTANVDGYVRVDATHFYFSYSTDTTVPGLGSVQDEDVVYYNAGTWSVYFDGTPKGLTSTNLDVDAFDLP